MQVNLKAGVWGGVWGRGVGGSPPVCWAMADQLWLACSQ